MPVEKVGKTVGNDAAGGSSGEVSWQRVEVTHNRILVIHTHQTKVYGGVRAAQTFD